jgi:hypothetical protein
LAALIIGTLALTGCPGAGPGNPSPSNFEDGNVDESVQSPLGKTSGEPNDDFDSAIVAVPDQSGSFRLKGTVESSNDIDVFLLGGLAAGDRVIAEALAATSLDTSIAIFDAEERLLADNDDRSDQNLDSRIDFVARHDSDKSYLVVTRSAFAGSSRRTGGYTADVEIQSGGTAPSPVNQVLFLKFDGGPVNSPQLGEMELAPFNASGISRVYAGKTEEIKAKIIGVTKQNYEHFNVTVRTSDDFDPGPNDEYSTIYFGGFNDIAFGLAENVDLYNAELCDDAIIFTESFTPFLFSTTPTAEEMGIAIGNVASHEAGHLLGLNHVDNDFDLMDDRSPADAFLIDQEFMESPLSTDIIPIGTQDGVLLLDEIVGPAGGASVRLIAASKQQVPSEAYRAGGVEIIKRQSRTKRPG